MTGQILAVDFEKRKLKDTWPLSESKTNKQSFYQNKTKICDNTVTVFTMLNSG